MRVFVKLLACAVIFILTPAVFSAVFDSAQWLRLEMLQVKFSWLSTAQASWYAYAINFVMAGLLSSLASSTLCLAARIPAAVSAAIVGLSIFVGFRSWVMLDLIQSGATDGLLVHLTLAIWSFLCGWLVAIWINRRFKGLRSRSATAANDLTPPSE